MVDVSIASVRAVVACVERRGISRDSLIARAPLRVPLVGDDLARVPFEDYLSVIRAALAVTADPALGLHAGESMSLGGFDVLGALAQQSATLRHAIATVNEYAKIIMDAPRFELHERGELAVLQLHTPDVAPTERRFITEFAMTAVVRHWLPGFSGAAAPARGVHFTHEAPPYHAEYTRVFMGRERFASELDGVELERHLLDTESLLVSPDLGAALRERADMLLSKLERARTVTERVRRWLTRPMPGRTPATQAVSPLASKATMREAAHALGTSERSLRRHLELEGVQYSELVDGVRAERAARMVGTGRYTLQEISYALGFANPTAFTRAYKRWTGKTPMEDQAQRLES